MEKVMLISRKKVLGFILCLITFPNLPSAFCSNGKNSFYIQKAIPDDKGR